MQIPIEHPEAANVDSGVWFARHDALAQWVKDNQILEWTNQQRFFATGS